MTSTSTGSRRAAPLPPDERRAAIVEAVMPALIERGATITTREIAAAAGVSEGTLFKVFDDKAALIDAAIDRALDQGPFEQAVRDVDPSMPFVEQLTEVVAVSQRRVVDIWRLLSQAGSTQPTRPVPDSPALTTLLATNADQIRLEPGAAARLLRALTLSLTHPLMTPTPHTADDIVGSFLHGAAR